MKNRPHTQNSNKRHQAEVRAARQGRRSFQVEEHFQTNCLTGGCGTPAQFHAPAFSEISKDYFAEEEPRGFAVEAIVFAALIATVLFPIVNSVQAVAALIHSIALF